MNIIRADYILHVHRKIFDSILQSIVILYLVFVFVFAKYFCLNQKRMICNMCLYRLYATWYKRNVGFYRLSTDIITFIYKTTTKSIIFYATLCNCSLWFHLIISYFLHIRYDNIIYKGYNIFQFWYVFNCKIYFSFLGALCNVHLVVLCTNSSFHHIVQASWRIYSSRHKYNDFRIIGRDIRYPNSLKNVNCVVVNWCNSLLIFSSFLFFFFFKSFFMNKIPSNITNIGTLLFGRNFLAPWLSISDGFWISERL